MSILKLEDWENKIKEIEKVTSCLEKEMKAPFASTRPRTCSKDRLLEKMGLKSRRIISRRAKKIS